MFRVIILVVALVAGGGAAWIALSLMGRSPAPLAVQEMPAATTRDVLVAAVDLAPGQPLTKESTRWQSWPEAAVLPGYVSRSIRPGAITELVGTVVRGKIIAGEPVRDDKLGVVVAGVLSTMLRSGKRAMAVRITAENTAGGFILPNDRVDVLYTLASLDKPEGQKEYMTRTLLTNITVLAIDQTLDEAVKDDKGKAKSTAVGKTATLELDPRQVESVAAAEAAGTLSLALRSAADNGEIAPPPQPAVVRPSLPTVVVVRGSSATIIAPKAP